MRLLTISAEARKAALICLSTLNVWMPSTAAGQDIMAGNAGLEEVVVTARKREENLQEIPLAIGVFTADDIQRIGIRDLTDVTKLSPSLQFDRSYSDNSIRVTIRGLSNTRGRSNVAFLVDGIDVTSETTGTNAGSPLLVNQRLLTDVERIEVVRGPQSALYGRAAFAGAINYVSKNPSEEFDGNVAVEVAQHDRQELYAGISGPISDTLGFRLSGVTWNDDGYYKNVVSGSGFGGGDGYGIAGTLRWEPTDSLSFKSRVTWSDDNYAPGAIAGIYGREVAVPVPEAAYTSDPIDGKRVTSDQSVSLLPFVGDADGLEVRSSEDPLTGGDYPGNTLEVFRTTLIADWDIGAAVLSSYTGFTDADMTQRYDLDRQAESRPDTILGHGEIDTFGNTQQISQEFRVASNWENSSVQLTGGIQYWKEERDDFSRSISVTCRNTGFCGPNQSFSPFATWQDIYAAVEVNSPDFRSPVFADTEHRSVYAMVEWSISDTVKLTVEDRLARETFDASLPIWSSCLNAFIQNADFQFYNPVTGENGPNCAMGPMQSGSVSSSYQAPKVTLEWQASDTAMLYALAGKGVKPAGISLIRVPVKIAVQPLETYVFEPEEMWSYEVGAKTEWQGAFGSLLINGAVFYQDYTDKQTNTQQAVDGCRQDVPQDQCLPEDIVTQTIGFVTNASAAWVTGCELETSWATPVEGLSLGLGYTWLDSEYDDFLDATRSAGRIASVGACDIVRIPDVQPDPNDPGKATGTPHCLLNLSGKTLEFMPEHSAVVTARYENDLFSTGMRWYVEGNASYQSERFTSADNYTELDAFWLADVRLGASNENWNVIAYINNLFDNNTISSSGGNTDVAAGWVDSTELIPPTLSTAFLPPPRTAGIRLQYQYR